MAKPLITDVSKLQFSKILELIPPIEFVKYLKKAIPPFPPPTHTHKKKSLSAKGPVLLSTKCSSIFGPSAI